MNEPEVMKQGYIHHAIKEESPNKMTTMDDVKKRLYEDFSEELCDCKRYHEMAEISQAHGHDEAAEALYTMSYEELTHAHAIKECMEHWGMTPMEEDVEKYHMLMNLFEGEM